MSSNKVSVFGDSFPRISDEDASTITELVRDYQSENETGITGPQLCRALFATGDEKHDGGLNKFQAAIAAIVANQCPEVETVRGPGGGYCIKGMERAKQSREGTADRVPTEEDVELVHETLKTLLSFSTKGVATNNVAMSLAMTNASFKTEDGQLDSAYTRACLEKIPGYENKQGRGWCPTQAA